MGFATANPINQIVIIIIYIKHNFFNLENQKRERMLSRRREMLVFCSITLFLFCILLITNPPTIIAQENETLSNITNQTHQSNLTTPYIDPEILKALENSTWVNIVVKYIGDIPITFENEEEMFEYYRNKTKFFFDYIPETDMRRVGGGVLALQPFLSAEVTRQGFDKLVNDSRVTKIFLNREVQIFQDESAENTSLTKNEAIVEKTEEPKSWFSGIIDFLRSLVNFFFQVDTNISKNATENQGIINKSEETNNTEAGIPEESEEIINTTNTTCGYCQYLVNNSCLNYECCKDDECKANEYCSENQCVSLNCSYCQYAENHKCVNYECCKDAECGTNETCVIHNCIPKAECPKSCDDKTNWTIDYCDTSTYLCEHRWIVPYCGNLNCELSDGENVSNCPVDCTGVSEKLYCEKDSDCVPCCAYFRLLDDGSYEIAGREPYGKCVNKNYTHRDVPTLCDKNTCQGVYGNQCIECNKCVNNQCITTGAICPWA
jgi:hypothetical protein